MPGQGTPPGYPPVGYPPVGAQAVGYGAAPAQMDSKSVVALVLAIASWVICPLITAIAALVLAGQSDRAIDESGGRLDGHSMNTATRWIAWANIALSVLALIALIGFLGWLATQDLSSYSDSTYRS